MTILQVFGKNLVLLLRSFDLSTVLPVILHFYDLLYLLFFSPFFRNAMPVTLNTGVNSAN